MSDEKIAEFGHLEHKVKCAKMDRVSSDKFNTGTLLADNGSEIILVSERNPQSCSAF